jgi:hypothetical protein
MGENLAQSGHQCNHKKQFIIYLILFEDHLDEQGTMLNCYEITILLNTRECSPVGVNEGVKILHSGQISPLWANLLVKN